MTQTARAQPIPFTTLAAHCSAPAASGSCPPEHVDLWAACSSRPQCEGRMPQSDPFTTPYSLPQTIQDEQRVFNKHMPTPRAEREIDQTGKLTSRTKVG